MKRIVLLSLLLVCMISSPVFAWQWPYPFVVWKGKIYEVKQEETMADIEIGNIIGKVKTQPSRRTGKYYGDASNHYPIGTKYYDIKGTSTSAAIAVQEENQWVKAVYIDKIPFSIKNVIYHNSYIISAVILIIVGIILRNKKKNVNKDHPYYDQ